MKRSIVLFFVVALLFSGCGFWMDGDFLSVEPNQPPGVNQQVISVNSYEQLLSTLLGAVENGKSQISISLKSFTRDMSIQAISRAVENIKGSNPIGAYCVKDIRYTITESSIETTGEFEISYRLSVKQIQEIQKLEQDADLSLRLSEAIQSQNDTLAVVVSSYNQENIRNLLTQFAEDYPGVKFSVMVYPEQGTERLISFSFGYKNN